MKPEKPGFCIEKATSAVSTTWSASSSTLQRKNLVSGLFISNQVAEDWQQTAVKLAREELARKRSDVALIRLRVSGSSMVPLIEPGDMVLVRHVNFEDLRRGDMILVEQGGTFLVHRLVAVHDHGVRTKGDNASHADVLVAPEDVLGRVVVVEKGNVLSLTSATPSAILRTGSAEPPKGGRRIELGQGQWPMVNRLLGLSGWCEAQFFAAGRRVKSKLPGAQSGRWPVGLASMAAAPFRWLTRLLINLRGFGDGLTG